MEKKKGKPDVVVALCEQARVPLLTHFSPGLVIRGHFGSGKYLVNGVPTVFTQDVEFSEIEFGNRVSVRQFRRKLLNPSVREEVAEGTCRPWGTTQSEFERYPWLERWPGQLGMPSGSWTTP